MVTSQSIYAGQWDILRRFLPEDLDASARTSGAMRRKRGQVQSGEDLLRILLMHTAGGLSLEQTVARASAQGLPKLNAMALHKRLCNSHQWLADLTTHLLEGIRPLFIRRAAIAGIWDARSAFSTRLTWRNPGPRVRTGAFITACDCPNCAAISLNLPTLTEGKACGAFP